MISCRRRVWLGFFRGLGATLATVPAFWGVYCEFPQGLCGMTFDDGITLLDDCRCANVSLITLLVSVSLSYTHLLPACSLVPPCLSYSLGFLVKKKHNHKLSKHQEQYPTMLPKECHRHVARQSSKHSCCSESSPQACPSQFPSPTWQVRR